MILLGAHMSISGGVSGSLLQGKQADCTTIQIFTKNANQWKSKDLAQKEIDKFFSLQKETQISPVVAHNSYLINLGSPNKELLDKSREAMLIELNRCEQLSLPYLVIHPGSHIGTGEKEGIKRIVSSLNWLFKKTAGHKVKICLETTAGQGSNLGYRFEQIAEMIKLVEDKKRIGICYDTCHTFAAGYDITTEKAYENTFKEFDNIIGLKKLHVIHLNDSKHALGSRKDRHEHIGKGLIGLDAFSFLMNDPRFQKIPKILETPKEDGLKMDLQNIKILKSLVR
jgi:deoxyribonuclease-4